MSGALTVLRSRSWGGRRLGWWRLRGGRLRRRRLGHSQARERQTRNDHKHNSSNNPDRKATARMHSTQFWHKHGAAAIPWAEVTSPLSYAICRHALGSLDGIRLHIG